MKDRQEKNLARKLQHIIKRLDIITVILLAMSGLTKEEIADVLDVSGKTIERMLPFGKIKRKGRSLFEKT